MGTVGALLGGSLLSGMMGMSAADKASKAQVKGAKKATDAELEMYYQSRADLAPWRDAGKWALGYQEIPVEQTPLLSYEDWLKQYGRNESSGFPTGQNYSQSRDEFDRGLQRVGTDIDPNRAAYNAYVNDWNERSKQTRMSDTFREGSLLDKISKGPGDYTKSPGYDFRLGEGVRAMEMGAAARGNVLSGAQTKALTQYGQDYATQDYDNYLRRWYQSLTPLQSLAGLGQTSAGQTASNAMQTGQNIGQNYLTAGQARASGYINQANTLTGALQSGTENYLLWDYLNRRNTTGGGVTNQYPGQRTL